MVGVSILAFTAVEGYNGYVVFVWIYGISCGGYNYTLKVYIFEKVRSRNFARVWSFAQFCMALPNLIGIPASGKFGKFFVARCTFPLNSYQDRLTPDLSSPPHLLAQKSVSGLEILAPPIS